MNLTEVQDYEVTSLTACSVKIVAQRYAHLALREIGKTKITKH